MIKSFQVYRFKFHADHIQFQIHAETTLVGIEYHHTGYMDDVYHTTVIIYVY